MHGGVALFTFRVKSKTSYNNNSKPWISSRILRAKKTLETFRDFAFFIMCTIFPHCFSCFFIAFRVSSFSDFSSFFVMFLHFLHFSFIFSFFFFSFFLFSLFFLFLSFHFLHFSLVVNIFHIFHSIFVHCPNVSSCSIMFVNFSFFLIFNHF